MNVQTTTQPTHRPTHPPRAAWHRLARRVLGCWPDVLAFGSAIAAAVLAAVVAAALAGCGGGVEVGGTGATIASFSQGPITGFGSIIVNGVRYDETAARVEDDEGGSRDRGALRLGMVVQVTAGEVTDRDGTPVATATQVRTTRALVGPASAVDVAGGRFTVLGQVVAVTADTAFDDRLSGGLAALAAAGPVEVYGSFDAATGRYTATRIDIAGSGSASKVSGPVSQIDPVARTCRIGGQTYSFAALGNVSGLTEGAVVRFDLQGGQDAGGRWVVSRQGSSGLVPGDGAPTELRGRVQSLASAGSFVVDGVRIDAGAARIDGTPRVGAAVRVSGTIRAGVLVATRVQVDSESAPQAFEVEGLITAIDAANQRFVVRGTLVSYAGPAVEFTRGTAAQLAVGRKVRVEGRLAADRSVLSATRIRIDD